MSIQIYLPTFYTSSSTFSSLIYGNITEHGLPEKSYNKYQEFNVKNLCVYLNEIELNYTDCNSIGNNISLYGMDSLQNYFLQNIVILASKMNILLIVNNMFNFEYNEIYYGTEKYNAKLLLQSNNADYEIFNPFYLLNDEIMKTLTILNDDIINNAFNEISNEIINDIFEIFKFIDKIILYFTYVYIIYICLLVIFYFFYDIISKNKEINLSRKMLDIIPKQIFFDILNCEINNKEIKNSKKN